MILPVLIERPSAAIRAELPWSSEAAVNNRSAAPEAEPFRDIPCKIAVFLHFHSSKVLSRIRIIRRNHVISGIIPQHNRRIKIPQEVPKHGISAINNTFFLCMAAHQTPSLEFRGFARKRERRSLSLKLVEIFTSPMNTNTAFEHKIPIKKALGRFLSRMLCHQSYVVTLPGASHPTGSALHQLIFCSLFHELIHGHLFLLCCSSHTSVKVRIKPQQHLS